MADPVSSRRSSPPHPTRQQLDDLDALMQRMLALPVTPGEGDGPPELARVSEPAEPVSSVSPTLPPTPLAEAPLPAPMTEITPSVAPMPEGPSFIEERPRATDPVAAEEEPARVPHRRPEIAGWLRPLLWSNRVFDRGTMRLGSPGRWLRGQRGRAFLGAAGLIMLAGAVAWSILDWMGWLW